MQRFLMACLLSITGSVIALELGAWWWVGLTLGFAAGFVGYDVRGFVGGVSRAFAEMRKGSASKETLRIAFYAYGVVESAFASFLVLLFVLDCLGGFIAIVPYGSLGIFFLLFGLIFTQPAKDETLEEHAKNIMRIHPIPLFFWRVPCGILWIIARIPRIIQFCGTFIATAFRYVHSNARLLFSIDVAIGVAIGYYTGNALLGGLAGGCWWLLDWHLISVRYMGLKAA